MRILRVRLVRYRHADTEYGIATSLLDDCRDPVTALSALDPARWGGEEMYKTGKFRIEAFHARSERVVRQELYAAFVLITLARPFADRCDGDLDDGDDRLALRTHFCNGLRLIGKKTDPGFGRGNPSGACGRSSIQRNSGPTATGSSPSSPTRGSR